MDVKNIVRLDIIEGKPRTFVHDTDLENGVFLEIIGKAKNAYLNVDGDYEAFKVKLATAETKRENLLFHCSVTNMYDERKLPCEFVLEKGKPGRGYMAVMGDTVTIPVACAYDGVAVGDELALGADGKLAKKSTDEKATDYKLAIVEALEDIEIPMYGGQWGSDTVVKDVVQKSVVIRFV